MDQVFFTSLPFIHTFVTFRSSPPNNHFATRFSIRCSCSFSDDKCLQVLTFSCHSKTSMGEFWNSSQSAGHPISFRLQKFPAYCRVRRLVHHQELPCTRPHRHWVYLPPFLSSWQCVEKQVMLDVQFPECWAKILLRCLFPNSFWFQDLSTCGPAPRH